MISPISPIGHSVEGFQVVGVEHDQFDRWTGADIVLKVPPVGLFAMRVVTEEAHLAEYLAESLLEIQEIQPGDFDRPDRKRPALVLDDDVLTYDALIDMLSGQVVRPELAASLFTVMDHDD